MGEQQKKVCAWRLGILSVLLVLAFLLSGLGVYLVVPTNSFAAHKLKAADDETRYWGTYDGEVDDGSGIHSGGFLDRKEKKIYISKPEELAYMRLVITTSGRSNSTEDYTGYTFCLSNDIDLSLESANVKDENGQYKKWNPYWMPVKIGRNKNRNIVFDGQGHKISGLRIKYDNVTSPENAGFFASMIGGAVMNVTFVDPVIDYTYVGTEGSEHAPRPSDVCIGIIAGEADSTYINNVTIENPTINFSSKNVNAHNFCVGGVVGKMTFTRKSLNESINTIYPNQWGLDKVKIYKSGAKQPSIAMTINQGEGAGYGNAAYGYFGGLVGANVSSKIINCTVQDAQLTPNIAADVAGNYYVGGMAGFSTQIAPANDLFVAAGLYNNLVMDVDLATVPDTDTDTRFRGNLVGRSFQGSWLYNNLVINIEHGYENLWEDVTNSRVTYDKLPTNSCIGHELGGLDPYYFDGSRNVLGYGDCATDSSYSYCTTHQNSDNFDSTVGFNGGYYNYCTGADAGTKMSELNYNYSSYTVEQYQADAFVSNKIYHRVGDTDEVGTTYAKQELMSNIADYYTLNGDVHENEQKGLLFYAALPILKYEKSGLTVDSDNTEDQLLEAVYQFCRWKNGEDGRPALGEPFGAKYTFTFYANGYVDDWYSEDYQEVSLRGTFKYERPRQLNIGDGKAFAQAYFVDDANAGYVNKNNSEKNVVRSYQQYVTDPGIPQCDGYVFLGWKPCKYDAQGHIVLDADGKPEVEPNPENYPSDLKNYMKKDGNRYYVFNLERVTTNRAFIAIWAKQKYPVLYYYRDPVTGTDRLIIAEEVYFGSAVPKITDPTSDQGFVFMGWYTATPDKGIIVDEDLNHWTFEDDMAKMPGNAEGLTLYTGWKNNAEALSELLDNATYREYYQNYALYFTNTLGSAYKQKYEYALKARAHPEVYSNEYGQLITELKAFFMALRVDPRKLMETNPDDKTNSTPTPAFDETKDENKYPFLYEADAYAKYLNAKNRVKEYAEFNPYDENFVADNFQRVIESWKYYYALLYNPAKLYDENGKMTMDVGAYVELSAHKKDSMVDDAGVLLPAVTELIAKYENVEGEYQALCNSGDYGKYDMTAVENARDLVNKMWNNESEYANTVLKQIKLAVDEYEVALQTKKVRTDNPDSDGANSGVKKTGAGLGISPIVLAVSIVGVLAVATFGFIGVDVILKKRRMAKLGVNVANKSVVEDRITNDDDDTYI